MTSLPLVPSSRPLPGDYVVYLRNFFTSTIHPVSFGRREGWGLNCAYRECPYDQQFYPINLSCLSKDDEKGQTLPVGHTAVHCKTHVMHFACWHTYLSTCRDKYELKRPFCPIPECHHKLSHNGQLFSAHFPYHDVYSTPVIVPVENPNQSVACLDELLKTINHADLSKGQKARHAVVRSNAEKVKMMELQEENEKRPVMRNVLSDDDDSNDDENANDKKKDSSDSDDEYVPLFETDDDGGLSDSSTATVPLHTSRRSSSDAVCSPNSPLIIMNDELSISSDDVANGNENATDFLFNEQPCHSISIKHVQCVGLILSLHEI